MYKNFPLINLYILLSNRLKKNHNDIMLFTLVVLILSELPIYLFTLLDSLKIKALLPYRLHYNPILVEHLGYRNYPSSALIWKAAKVAHSNFLFAYLIPGFVAISIANKLELHPYDTDKDNITFYRLLRETLSILILADFFFYGLHRLMHTKRFYVSFHKKHHFFKYSIALAHHYMTYKEALLFALPQALPPLILWGLGKRTHILSMWTAFFFTQMSAILGHAGWQVPFIPTWLTVLQAPYHDYHHVDYSVNFGALSPITDKVFGTYFLASPAKT